MNIAARAPDSSANSLTDPNAFLARYNLGPDIEWLNQQARKTKDNECLIQSIGDNLYAQVDGKDDLQAWALIGPWRSDVLAPIKVAVPVKRLADCLKGDKKSTLEIGGDMLFLSGNPTVDLWRGGFPLDLFDLRDGLAEDEGNESVTRFDLTIKDFKNFGRYVGQFVEDFKAPARYSSKFAWCGDKRSLAGSYKRLAVLHKGSLSAPTGIHRAVLGGGAVDVKKLPDVLYLRLSETMEESLTFASYCSKFSRGWIWRTPEEPPFGDEHLTTIRGRLDGAKSTTIPRLYLLKALKDIAKDKTFKEPVVTFKGDSAVVEEGLMGNHGCSARAFELDTPVCVSSHYQPISFLAEHLREIFSVLVSDYVQLDYASPSHVCRFTDGAQGSKIYEHYLMPWRLNRDE